MAGLRKKNSSVHLKVIEMKYTFILQARASGHVQLLVLLMEAGAS